MPTSSLAIQPTKFPGPAVPSQQGIILVDTFTFSIAQVTALNGTPIEFLPGIDGYVYAPLSCVIYKNGPRYDTCPGVIRIQWTGYTTSFPIASGQGMPAAYMIATGNISFLSSGFAPAGVQAAEILSKGLTITATIGNPTVTVGNPGFPLTILITYLLIPGLSSNIQGY